jgi:hypothetical protein
MNNMSTPSPEYRWFYKYGTYENRTTVPRPRRRKAIKRDSGTGAVCPGCGLTRSRTNKCECNS